MIEKAQATTITVALKNTDGDFVTNPTIASGDVKVSIDHGALTNIATLPTVEPAGTTSVKVTLSADETNCDNLEIYFVDQAGAEWVPMKILIRPRLKAIDQVIGSKTLGQIVSYCGAVLVGTISNAGEDIETFTFPGGIVVQVTVGEDGNRTAVMFTDP